MVRENASSAKDKLNPDMIPAELRALPQWVCWRYETRKGKETKIPINASSGYEADCTDRSQFSAFEAALSRFEKLKNLDGVGFVFSDQDPFVGIDLDDCIDTSNGSFSDLAKNVLERFPFSYAEISPSGTGIKLWVKGSLPIPQDKTGRKNPKLGVETYCRGRYFTTTSHRVVHPDSGRTIEQTSEIFELNDELQKWFLEMFPVRQTNGKKDETPAVKMSVGVQDIVHRASASRSGDKFRRLWAGDCSEFGDDQSSADLALCTMLAFWCGPNANLIDECFRASGLFREKWERSDYRDTTIQKAIDGCSEFYNWDRPQTKPVLCVPELAAVKSEWPELFDLEEPPLDRLPEELLPGWYGDMIRAVATATETPLEMAAMVALAAIATATMRKYDVLIQAGFRQSLNLFCVPVMEPGNRKSAVHRQLTAPIEKFEWELRHSSSSEIKTAESKLKTWEKRIESLRGRVAKAKNHGEVDRLQKEIEDLERDTPSVPHRPQLTADDATPESLCYLLSCNDERIALSSAEPEVFDMMMGRYSNKPNLGIYLKAHDGDQHKENRKSGIPVSLSAPLMTINVMSQPEAINEAGQQKVLKGRGLLARFLFVMPPSPVGYRDCECPPVPKNITSRYNDCLRKLLLVPIVKSESERPQPRLLRLSLEAFNLWKREQLRIESDQQDGGCLAAFKDWAGKFPAQIARIAGNLHLANCVGSEALPEATPIPADTMATAIQFATVIKSHTLKVFGAMNSDKNRKTALKIIQKIRDERMEEITKRECHRADRTLDTVLEVQPVIDLLIRDGYLMPVDDDSKRGRPSEKYRVNPAAHLKPDDGGSLDKKDNKAERAADFEQADNSALFVAHPEESDSDEPAESQSAVDDFEFEFSSDRRPPG